MGQQSPSSSMQWVKVNKKASRIPDNGSRLAFYFSRNSFV